MEAALVADGMLITGQNTQSAGELAFTMLSVMENADAAGGDGQASASGAPGTNQQDRPEGAPGIRNALPSSVFRN